MKKFYILLKKEVKELLTLQLILPFIAVVVVFMLIGNFLGDEAKKQATSPGNLAIMDKDNTSLTNDIIDMLKKNNIIITSFPISDNKSFIDDMKSENINVGIIIPENFSSQINNKLSENIETYSIINNFTITATKNSTILGTSMTLINDYITSELISLESGSTDISIYKTPIKEIDNVIVNNKTASVNPNVLTNFVMGQTTFIPIILFLVIVLAAQMIATAIATEKENKTLETLLSTPVPRQTIVTAKMVAAALVALLMAIIYMYGMGKYMNGVTGGAFSSNSENIKQIAESLGLTFDIGSYAILGVSLFFGILLALAIAMILGAFSEDSKSAQGVITPLMILVLIPYFLSLFIDPNTLAPIYRYLVYAIPFTHIFLAAPNLLLGNYLFVIYGIIYLAIIFLVFVYIVARIFSSDYIMTMKLNFGRKK
jgi:ABC-2 type transport system permease protein